MHRHRAGDDAEVDPRGAPGALPRGRDRQRGLRPAVPRLQGRQGHLDRRHRRLHQRDGAVPQPVAVPPRRHARTAPRRTTSSSRTGSVRSSANSSRRPRPRDSWCRRSSTASSPSTRTGRPGRVDRRGPRPPSGCASAIRASSAEPFLCIADFFRPIAVRPPVGAGEADYAAFHIVSMGASHLGAQRRALRRGPLPGVPPAARPGCGDGRGARGVLAPPHPRGMGLRRSGSREVLGQPDPDRARRAVPPEVPQWALLVGLPGMSGPGGQREGRRAAGARSRIGVECDEETGFQYQPEQTTSALICHHPRAKYFVAK